MRYRYPLLSTLHTELGLRVVSLTTLYVASHSPSGHSPQGEPSPPLRPTISTQVAVNSGCSRGEFAIIPGAIIRMRFRVPITPSAVLQHPTYSRGCTFAQTKPEGVQIKATSRRIQTSVS